MTEIKYQKLINRWCEKYSIPSIKVKIIKELIDAQAEFEPEKYQILVTKETTEKVLKHEFCHYAIRLLQVMDDVEEKICDIFEEVEL